MKKVLLIVESVVLVFGSGIALLLFLNRDRVTRFASGKVFDAIEMALAENIHNWPVLAAAHTQVAAIQECAGSGQVTLGQIKDLTETFNRSYGDRHLDSLEVSRILVQIRTLAGK